MLFKDSIIFYFWMSHNLLSDLRSGFKNISIELPLPSGREERQWWLDPPESGMGLSGGCPGSLWSHPGCGWE